MTYREAVKAIREMIINAHCHRCLTDDSCVQVAIYDDRLEVTSPGGLYNGLTYEEVLNGHSRLRNRGIANVFNQMGMIEAWGTGIKRIIHLAGEYTLPVPAIQAFDSMFRVNLYRSNSLSTGDNNLVKFGEDLVKFGKSIGEALEKHRRSIGETSEKVCVDESCLNDTQRKILNFLSEDAQLSAAKMAEQIGISRRNIEANIRRLKEWGILVRHGSPKNGYWEILKK